MRSLRRTTWLLVFVLTAIVAVPAAALALPASPAASAAAPGGASVALPSVAATSAAPAAAPTAAAPASLAGNVLGALHAAGAPMSHVFLPNFNARPSVQNGVVTPLYGVAPAPMGLGYFGTQEVNGSDVGTISYTPSVEGALTLNSIDPMYLPAAGPDQFTVQLNTVLTGVDVMGNLSNQFWIQNVPVYFESSHTLAFEDNIWNFSSPAVALQSSSIYSHGPGGFIIPGVVYIAVGPSFHVPTPFTVRVYNNATVTNDRPTIWFNYSVTEANGTTFSGSYDVVEFNSTGLATPTGPAPMPSFQINGQSANPTGFLLNDAEIMLGGPGGGSTTNILAIDGSMGLWTLPNGTTTYRPVPAAYDFGTDTGETAAGIAEWATRGSNPMAQLTTGPSLLGPLWGLTGAQFGRNQMQFSIQPSNAFVFVSPGATFDSAVAAWAPVPVTGQITYSLPPGTYSWKILLSDYRPMMMTTTGNSSTTVHLRSAPALGIYTPLWAQTNGQLAAISQSGNGTVANPYVLFNGGNRPINPLFGEFNDYVWPVFPGIQLVNTTAYVTIEDMPAFSITYSLAYERAVVSGLGLPATNELEYNLYGVQHVSIVNNPAISGWFFVDDQATLASVVFWNSSNNLVAGNVFDVMSTGLLLFGGHHNTIWGNEFTGTLPVATSTAQIANYGFQWALVLYESGDLTYNNAFLTPITAYTPTVNIYNGVSELYRDQWNVRPQPATNGRMVNGWNLTGSILGLSWQGGNYWSNYGSPSLAYGSPYGVLPYANGGLISYFGDFAPLTPAPLYKVVFTETGLSPGTSWSVTFNGVTESTTLRHITFWAMNGTYAWVAGNVTGFTAAPSSGAAIVAGTNQVVAITWT